MICLDTPNCGEDGGEDSCGGRQLRRCSCRVRPWKSQGGVHEDVVRERERKRGRLDLTFA